MFFQGKEEHDPRTKTRLSPFQAQRMRISHAQTPLKIKCSSGYREHIRDVQEHRELRRLVGHCGNSIATDVPKDIYAVLPFARFSILVTCQHCGTRSCMTGGGYVSF